LYQVNEVYHTSQTKAMNESSELLNQLNHLLPTLPQQYFVTLSITLPKVKKLSITLPKIHHFWRGFGPVLWFV
jgi:hypothetical protein